MMMLALLLARLVKNVARSKFKSVMDRFVKITIDQRRLSEIMDHQQIDRDYLEDSGGE